MAQTRGLASAARIGGSSLCCSSAAMLRISTAFSLAVSHLALLMRSSSHSSTSTPMMTDGMPSSRNSHCQPDRPWSPWKVFMIQPEIGPPIRPDMGTAVMKKVVMRPRRSAGYQ